MGWRLGRTPTRRCPRRCRRCARCRTPARTPGRRRSSPSRLRWCSGLGCGHRRGRYLRGGKDGLVFRGGWGGKDWRRGDGYRSWSGIRTVVCRGLGGSGSERGLVAECFPGGQHWRRKLPKGQTKIALRDFACFRMDSTRAPKVWNEGLKGLKGGCERRVGCVGSEQDGRHEQKERD